MNKNIFNSRRQVRSVLLRLKKGMKQAMRLSAGLPLFKHKEKCRSCGYELNADFNARISILERGLLAVGLGRETREELLKAHRSVKSMYSVN